MKSRSLFLTIAAGLLVAGIGARDARAANVPLPTTLDALLPTGSTATVVGAETLTFSTFGYTSTAIPASAVTVSPFTGIANETGLQFSGSFSAPAMTTIDMAITYVVTAPAGELINDAFLSAAGSGSGGYTIGETLVNAVTGVGIGTLSDSNTSPTATLSFAGVSSIFVTKDISITGGASAPFVLSVVQQGFSSSTIPEPSSLALLGIGMTGFLAFRRLFKRTSVA